MTYIEETPEQDCELISVAMNIILYSGTAKTLADEAFECAKQQEFIKAYKKLEAASSQGILKAHRCQMEIIQDEAKGIVHNPSLLFTHAQDHLMTTMLEVRTTKKMIELYELLNNKK